MRRPANILWLGLKELRSLASDPVLVAFILYAFTLAIITQARGVKSEVNNASLAFIDEDQSQLSKELIAAFYPPRFQHPQLIAPGEATGAMDRGRYMFIVAIPPRFESDLRRGRPAEVQVNMDATAMQQASIGAGYIKNILTDRVASFIHRTDAKPELPLRVVVRKAFNPNGDASWFTAIVALINQITTLTVVLTGAALIREREHGTIEHLLTLPLTPFEIAMSKVWANGLVILAGRHRLDVLRRPHPPGRAHRRLARAVPLRGRALPVLRHGARALPGHDHPLDGPVRALDHPGHHRAATALGRQHARGEPAPVDAAAHAVPPLAPLRRLLPGHHLPGRRARDRLAAVPRRRRHRPRLLRLQPRPVPPVHRCDQVGP